MASSSNTTKGKKWRRNNNLLTKYIKLILIFDKSPYSLKIIGLRCYFRLKDALYQFGTKLKQKNCVLSKTRKSGVGTLANFQ